MGTVSVGTRTAYYGYGANSDLLQTTALTNAGNTFLTSRTWDYGSRLRSVQNSANGAAVSAHAYLYDGLNRRFQATLEVGSLWQYQYNDRNELIAGKRFLADWTPVAGQQFAYGFDSIGNRTNTWSGGDQSGGNLRSASYTANALNQITARGVPASLDVIGAAYATASVTVNGSTGEADELYQRRLREVKITEEMRKSILRELDALEDAIGSADLSDVLRHKLILEVLLG